jgi:hypothetical protein
MPFVRGGFSKRTCSLGPLNAHQFRRYATLPNRLWPLMPTQWQRQQAALLSTTSPGTGIATHQVSLPMATIPTASSPRAATRQFSAAGGALLIFTSSPNPPPIRRLPCRIVETTGHDPG